MNTRQAIQPSTTPAVLSLSFSPTRKRFAAGLAEGLRIFRSDNCLTTYTPPNLQASAPAYTTSKEKPELKASIPKELEGGIAIAEVLDDRYIVFVSGGRLSNGRESVVVFWDCVLERETARLDFSEPIKGLKVSGKWMVVVLPERTVVLSYQKLRRDSGVNLVSEVDHASPDEPDGDEALHGPNKVHALHHTATNPYALSCLRDDVLVVPAQSIGQVALIPLPSGSKRVLRAHNTALRCLALSSSGTLLATSSEQGTLVRVFDTKTLDQIAEFRRGVEKAIILGLAFCDGGRWLACTSDKGTIHIFDLRPPPSRDDFPTSSRPSTAVKTTQHRKSQSQNPNRLSLNTDSSNPKQPTSLLSSSPSTATKQTATPSQPQTHVGSIQEYYGLLPPPPPVHTQPPLTNTYNAFKTSSWAPKVLKDVRSVASAPFFLGSEDEGPYWQGGKGSTWTTDPSGTRRRVRNPIPSLPAEPAGRAPKGVVAFAPKGGTDGREDDEGAVIYVLGGGLGAEARWECFDLVATDQGGWVLVKRGFRRILGRQFVD